MPSMLITGINSFIGRVLCRRVIADGWHVRGTTRNSNDLGVLPPEAEIFEINSIDSETDWSKVLAGVDTVIHLAARVHVMLETAADPLAEFRRVNAAGTESLARQATVAGVKRFIFLSTIGVNGNSSGKRPFIESDEPCPHNPYSISKLEAEICLKEISEKTGMEVVIVRAPVVYGPGNPGNFLSLIRIIAKGIPLPLASVCNLKSFIYVGNLVDAITACATHPAAAGKIFLVSDGEDVSTYELIRRMAAALGMPAKLFHFPDSLLRMAGRLTGKTAAVDSLIGSLTVDSSKIRQELGWKPPFTMEQGLAETAKWYRASINNQK